jgi:hypothetical protein
MAAMVKNSQPLLVTHNHDDSGSSSGNVHVATSFTSETATAVAFPLPVGSCAAAMPARVRRGGGPAATSFPSEVVEASPMPRCGQVTRRRRGNRLREFRAPDRHRDFTTGNGPFTVSRNLHREPKYPLSAQELFAESTKNRSR